MNVVDYTKLGKGTKINLSEKKISLSISNICWFLFGLQVFMSNVTKHSIFYKLSASLFIGLCFLYLLTHKAIKINKYYLITLVFVIYNAIFIFLGDVTNAYHSFQMLKTISINLVLYILTYSFLVYTSNTDKLIKLYINISALSNLVILFMFRDSLFTGRLAFSWGNSVSSYQLFGINVITSGSNGIAYYSAIGFLFSAYLFLTNRKKVRYVLFNLLFVFTIFATGSRKGLIILAVSCVFLINILNKKSKKVVYGIIAIGLIILTYFLTKNVPALYEVIGSRMEELFNLILNKSVNDASINTRMTLIKIAVDFIKAQPIFGYGLDAFRIIGPWEIVSDNNYLDILVSSGIIGFIIYYSYVLLVLYDYWRIKKKSNICKIFFFVFILNLIMEYAQVTYFERSYGIINTMLFYILYNERKGDKNEKTSK